MRLRRLTSTPKDFLLRVFMIGLGLAVLAGNAARAQTPSDIFLKHLYEGRHQAGLAELQKQPESAETQFSIGMLRFAAAVERLGQSFHRHGLDTPRQVMIPLFRLPVPFNASPEPLTYQALRDVLETFRADLSEAEKALSSIGDRPVKIAVNPSWARIDLNNDGVAEDGEQLWALFNALTRSNIAEETVVDFTIAFDTGDAAWLAGYCNVMMAFTDFLLAHDFSEVFNSSFHLLFPSADAAVGNALRQDAISVSDYGSIADSISLIHNIRWPLVEPERMKRVRRHLLAVAAHSRSSWRNILAETDNDREWLPNPKQTGIMPQMVVTDEMVRSWSGVMNNAEDLLEGRKLTPHWRFRRGVNLKKVFEEPTTFDMVLWITGPAAVPYLEQGPMVTGAEWDRVTRAFGQNFFAYAVWFN